MPNMSVGFSAQPGMKFNFKKLLAFLNQTLATDNLLQVMFQMKEKQQNTGELLAQVESRDTVVVDDDAAGLSNKKIDWPQRYHQERLTKDDLSQ